MSEGEATAEDDRIEGKEITLPSGAKVAIFTREGGPTLLRFTNAAGYQTRLALSDAAVTALIALLIDDHALGYRMEIT